MLSFSGSPRKLCDGVTRRDLLHLGGLGMFGLSLSDALRLQELQADETAAAVGGFGKAKACILIHLIGAPPQHETFDPKPLAPAEIQGELKAISTCVTGVEIGEGLPRTAGMLDKLTVIRSLTHHLPFHHVHYAMSGIPDFPKTEADPNDRSLWPCIGSVVDYLDQQRDGNLPTEIPRHIAMPYVMYSRCQFRPLGGPYAGFLGGRYDPIWTEFRAQGTRAVPPSLAKGDGIDWLDPFAGIRVEDRFEIAGPTTLNAEMSPQRLGVRRALMSQFDASRRWMDAQERVRTLSRHQELAWSLLSSGKMASALDLQQEPIAVRERYGMNLFGQSLLAARRLIEAGGRFLTVFWDAYGHFTAGWDTHFQHYPRLKEYLLPVFDRSFTALIEDLDSRGLLDETLVLCISEHGRTPKITTNVPGAGREHWSRVYSGVMAGGGIGRGKVVGKSDAIGGDVAETPISPKDLLATSFHLLGMDPHTMVRNQQGRPFPIAGAGSIRAELIG
ncbi:MAG: DUF1501 domain-containing protein [Planctomycetaceae bacterium]|nr:DUF1501 domain-containing protein [Planctomycetaceae bacterium]